MIIRTAKSDDAPGIADIWNLQIRDTANTFTTLEKTPAGLAHDIETRRSEGKSFLVAEDGDRVIGFATYFQFRGGPGYAHTMEHSLALVPEAQGKGIGPNLMSTLESQARAAGIHSMFAAISAENPRAVTFHECIGYRKVGVMPEVGRKFDRWIDLILLQKLL